MYIYLCCSLVVCEMTNSFLFGLFRLEGVVNALNFDISECAYIEGAEKETREEGSGGILT